MYITKFKGLEKIFVEGMDLIELYRRDPVLAAQDLLNIDLAPVQRLILRDMWDKSFVIVVAGRGSGKTYMLAVVSVLSALLFPAYRVGLLGPGFRQAKNIFLEIERIYDLAPIFRQACIKRPTRGPDSCYVKFRGSEGVGSYIEALPLGLDGAKIRGSRFFTICTDEFAQVNPNIFNVVIKPMAATARNPMENVRRIERQRELLKRGLIDKIDEGGSINKIFMTSSGYYKFNHLWSYMKKYWKLIKEGNDRYAVWQVPYTDLPEGFINLEMINEAKMTMTNSEFMTEYMAQMVSDSDGVFRASLLENCTLGSNYSIKLLGDRDKQYILGIDVASKQDAFAISVVELGDPNRLVCCIEETNLTFPEMAKQIILLLNKYNVVRIFMDRFGGGESLKDILALGIDGSIPIIEYENEGPGRKLLELCTPTTQWIADSNFNTKALLEHKRLLFPEPPYTTGDEEADAYEVIKKTKRQLMSIVMTENPGGSLRFNTQRKDAHKDLYSSFVLAGWGISKMLKEQEEEATPILFQSGLLTPRNLYTKYTHLPNSRRLLVKNY